MSLLSHFATLLFAVFSFVKDFLDEGKWESKLLFSLIPLLLLTFTFCYDFFWFLSHTSIRKFKFFMYRMAYRDPDKFSDKLMNLSLSGNPIYCNICFLSDTRHFGGEAIVLCSDEELVGLDDLQYVLPQSKEHYFIGHFTFTFDYSNSKLSVYNATKTVLKEFYFSSNDIMDKLEAVIKLWELNPEIGVCDKAGLFQNKFEDGCFLRHSLTIQQMVRLISEGAKLNLIKLADLNYKVEGEESNVFEMFYNVGDKIIGENNNSILLQILQELSFNSEEKAFLYNKFMKLKSCLNISQSYKKRFGKCPNIKLKKLFSNVNYFLRLINYGTLTYTDHKVRISDFTTQLCRKATRLNIKLHDPPKFKQISKIKYGEALELFEFKNKPTPVVEMIIAKDRKITQLGNQGNKFRRSKTYQEYNNDKKGKQVVFSTGYKDALLKKCGKLDPKNCNPLDVPFLFLQKAYEKSNEKTEARKSAYLAIKENRDLSTSIKNMEKKSTKSFIKRSNKKLKKIKGPIIESVNIYNVLLSPYVNGDWIFTEKRADKVLIRNRNCKNYAFLTDCELEKVDESKYNNANELNEKFDNLKIKVQNKIAEKKALNKQKAQALLEAEEKRILKIEEGKRAIAEKIKSIAEEKERELRITRLYNGSRIKVNENILFAERILDTVGAKSFCEAKAQEIYNFMFLMHKENPANKVNFMQNFKLIYKDGGKKFLPKLTEIKRANWFEAMEIAKRDYQLLINSNP